MVLGISADRPSDNLEFKQKYSLPFSLLCDVGREVSMRYGACSFKKAYYTRRITYLIDEQGLIQRVFGQVDAQTHPQEVLAALK